MNKNFLSLTVAALFSAGIAQASVESSDVKDVIAKRNFNETIQMAQANRDCPSRNCCYDNTGHVVCH